MEAHEFGRPVGKYVDFNTVRSQSLRQLMGVSIDSEVTQRVEQRQSLD